MISWMRRQHKYIAFNANEEGYIAASMASCKEVWLRKLFRELFEHALETTIINCNNKSGI